MAKDISVEMKLPLEDGEELLPELEKEAEKEDKESNKVLAAAEDAVDDINAPKGVEVPKEIPFKTLTEKLHLNEDLDEDEYFDLVHEIYKAIEAVCRKWAKFSDVDYEDFEKAISEAAEKVIDSEPDLWESLKGEVEEEEVVEEACEEEPINEELKIISSLATFKPWSGAVDTWEKIEEAGLIDELDSILEDVYPEGLTETELNDLLWFEPEWVLESLGLSEENPEEDED